MASARAPDSFYVTLPSNACLLVYPENATSHFITRLAAPLDFNDAPYEVGLIDLQFQKNIANFALTKDERTVVLHNIFADGKQSGKLLRVIIPEGNYKVKKLLDIMNRLVQKSLDEAQFLHITTYPTFSYEKNTVQFTVGTREQITNILGKPVVTEWLVAELSPRFQEMLGFEYDLLVSVKHELQAQKAVQTLTASKISKELKTPPLFLFIYSDIIQSQTVADVKAPLLRVVPIMNSVPEGEVVHMQFQTPLYIPLHRSHVQDITVEIRSRTGEYIPFLPNSLAVLTLHFRRLGYGS